MAAVTLMDLPAPAAVSLAMKKSPRVANSRSPRVAK